MLGRFALPLSPSAGTDERIQLNSTTIVFDRQQNKDAFQ